jgi:glycosyltransferase involved in cell wall biosynthesis
MEKFISITGWLDNVELYLNEMKLLVLPSFTEGLPNILLEAMACGTPVLATPVGAIQDIIKNGETGFLLKSNDPHHIAEKVTELLNKSWLLEKVSINACHYVRENFSYERTLESWRRILQEI